MKWIYLRVYYHLFRNFMNTSFPDNENDTFLLPWIPYWCQSSCLKDISEPNSLVVNLIGNKGGFVFLNITRNYSFGKYSASDYLFILVLITSLPTLFIHFSLLIFIYSLAVSRFISSVWLMMNSSSYFLFLSLIMKQDVDFHCSRCETFWD